MNRAGALLVALAALQLVLGGPCPCSDPSLCKVLQIPPRKEVFGFQVNPDNWPYYDYSRLTTIALFGGAFIPGLYCKAHANGVRVVFGSGFSASQLGNATFAAEFVQSVVDYALQYNLDGVNIDFEDAVDANSPQMYELTQLVESVQSAMHKAIPGSVVSIDVAWSPNCIDDRCYDYAALARVTDLMFIMSYDLPSQVFPPQPCVALPCTPLQGARQGAEAYIELGIPTSVLILGLPWYGFDYPCLMENATAPLCPIPEVPYRGANCSDAAAGQIDYRVLSAQAARATTPVTLDSTSQSLWYNYVNDSQVRQVWMDDADTLRPKYQLAVDLGLIGVGMWNLDGLDYTSADPNVQRQTQAMWEALNVFLKPAAAHGRL